MNENFLQDEPLKLFDDFMQIPDQAFEDGRDIREINSLIETIINSEDFARVVCDSRYNNPDEFNHYDRMFNDWISKAKQNAYGTGKKKEMVISFMTQCKDMFNEIKETNGYFQKIPVKFCKVGPDAILPKYQSIGDAGADIYAYGDYVINPGETKVVSSGVKAIIPGGYRISIVPRSGLSLKTGIRIANAPGTIDSTYRNAIGVIVNNTGNEPYEIKSGDRIAQMILEKTPKIVFEEVTEEEFDKYKTNRGQGFGSSGK